MKPNSFCEAEGLEGPGLEQNGWSMLIAFFNTKGVKHTYIHIRTLSPKTDSQCCILRGHVQAHKKKDPASLLQHFDLDFVS